MSHHIPSKSESQWLNDTLQAMKQMKEETGDRWVLIELFNKSALTKCRLRHGEKLAPVPLFIYINETLLIESQSSNSTFLAIF